MKLCCSISILFSFLPLYFPTIFSIVSLTVFLRLDFDCIRWLFVPKLASSVQSYWNRFSYFQQCSDIFRPNSLNFHVQNPRKKLFYPSFDRSAIFKILLFTFSYSSILLLLLICSEDFFVLTVFEFCINGVGAAVAYK